MRPSEILAISALDSSGGAGLNQDIWVCCLFGKQLQTCLTGVTIQTPAGVVAIHPVCDTLLSSQIEGVLKDSEFRLVKIGALCSPTQVDVFLKLLQRPRPFKVILDPVLKPSRGLEFMADIDLGRYMNLLEITDFICPNLIELEALTSTRLDNFKSALKAARKLAMDVGINVLLKGGHGKGEPIKEAFVTADKVVLSTHPRRPWKYSHGTGCAFASAFMCYLSENVPPEEAFRLASQWVVDFYDRLNGLPEI
ncbi:MAG: bifunctional hydroxymethylpyrimidine kinase/phosphomethylpyrimidine kinase [Candidatus Syntrophosphaera sp.]|nr:bifunctional hydroxymethylpyrimidine kinase/phosphomethylpyrimidine kinase [Candidatus Syntrophosphaera sp.]